MFRHAIRHSMKKARIDIRNAADLTPLTLAAKLGRKELFLECLELAQVVKKFCFSFDKYLIFKNFQIVKIVFIYFLQKEINLRI